VLLTKERAGLPDGGQCELLGEWRDRRRNALIEQKTEKRLFTSKVKEGELHPTSVRRANGLSC